MAEPTVGDEDGLGEKEQGPQREEQTMQVEHGRTAERPAGYRHPVGQQEAAECYDGEYGRHRDVEASDECTRTGGSDRRHKSFCVHVAASARQNHLSAESAESRRSISPEF